MTDLVFVRSYDSRIVRFLIFEHSTQISSNRISRQVEFASNIESNLKFSMLGSSLELNFKIIPKRKSNHKIFRR